MILNDPLLLAEAIKRCESEPIQYIGSIQRHGVLLAVDAHSVVRAVSANLSEIIDIAAQAALGLAACLVLGEHAWNSIMALGVVQDQPPVPLEVSIQRGSVVIPKQTFIHRSAHWLVIEIECIDQTERERKIDFELTSRVLNAILADTENLATYADTLALNLRLLTGFDRVMVYQFDHAWNGQVIAESDSGQVKSFLGHHFPASDIPEPARRLYTKNLVRILVDRDAASVPLLTAQADLNARAIDLSYSVLRSISPVHLKYLENLDVAASVSVSLLQHGRLWGLMVCHHRESRGVPLKLRDTLELIARTAAIRLSALAFDDSLHYQFRLRETGLGLLMWAQNARNLASLDPLLQQLVFSLTQSTGLAVVTPNESCCFGQTPVMDEISGLHNWLMSRMDSGRSFSTHALAVDFPEASGYVGLAAGLLAIKQDDSGKRMALWFRGESVRSISWAGEAKKHLVVDELGSRLEPRRSFELWQETHRGESLPWQAQELDAAQTLSLTLDKILADEWLRQSEESLRLAALVYHSSSEAMVVTDANGAVVAINPAFSKLTGYTLDEVKGRSLSLLKSGRQDASYYQAMWHAIETTGTWRGELWNKHKTGEMYAEFLIINTIYDDSGAVWRRVGLITNITTRKLAESELEQYQQNLEQLVLSRTVELENARNEADSANRAKSSFLANMSHELRTPMSAILGLLKLLQKTMLTRQQLDYASKSEAAAKSLLSLLNDILDLSKVEAGKLTLDPVPFRMDRLISELTLILSANVGAKNIEVLFDVDAALPEVVVGDSLRLKQVLTNLGGNAVKFTSDGQVVVGMKLLEKEAQCVVIEFTVRDTGIGIALEHQSRIFGIYSQAEVSTTRRFGGTGLGLSISRRLVELMGGELKFESELGVGSNFYFRLTLPVVVDIPPELVVSVQIDPKTLTALVIDDNAVACDLTVAMLRAEGVQVECARNGREAVQIIQTRLREGLSAFHVIFLDWKMPDMDGWETARQIHDMQLTSAQAASLLIMVTANSREMLSQRTEQEQKMIDGFLAKPVSASMLLDAVVRARSMDSKESQVGSSQRRLEGMRILVVEDNMVNQQVADELLSSEGALVSLAANGQLGVESVAAADPQFDVVLMDIQMPVLDGHGATQIIRKELGLTQLPVIAMSANVMASDRAASLAIGMTDHVGKPFELAPLVTLLRRYAGWPESG